MEIRYAHLGDLPAIVQLEQNSFSPEEQIAEPVLASYVSEGKRTCLVMEEQGQIVGHLLALPSHLNHVTDALFYGEAVYEGDFLVIASLAVAADHQGQGIGTLLLAGLKEVASEQAYQGISLTCQDSLVGYYEWNGFVERGLSVSTLGNKSWSDLYWATSN